MQQQPSINTNRLILRPFQADDAVRVCALLNDDPHIAEMMIDIPYPCPLSAIEAWIAVHPGDWESRKSGVFAITLRESGALIGTVSLVALDSQYPETGFWLGKDFRRKGFTTEANDHICQFAFEQLGLTQLYSCHLRHNSASGRVLLKSHFHFLDCKTLFVPALDREETLCFYRRKA
ncbi:GNAT family N-acetyltransferase [Pectobacteriaceae bacterium CE90]|nr:GNAT family N-acetyltransferase [Pectobacteriaceae bacterium CE90]